MSIVIVTLNVNGMSDNNNRNAIYYWCRKKKKSILFAWRKPIARTKLD
jgi:hypothetical protein